jgi:hypothetical protein
VVSAAGLGQRSPVKPGQAHGSVNWLIPPAGVGGATGWEYPWPVQYLLAIPVLAFALWLKFRPFRNGTYSELWGAPTDEDLTASGLPPRDPNSAQKKQPTERLFGPFPEDNEAANPRP